MSMTIAGLQAQIRTQLDTYYGTPQDHVQADDLAGAIATAVVNYLKSNLTVTTTIPGSNYTAPASGGPCTGTATVTGVIS